MFTASRLLYARLGKEVALLRIAYVTTVKESLKRHGMHERASNEACRACFHNNAEAKSHERGGMGQVASGSCRIRPRKNKDQRPRDNQSDLSPVIAVSRPFVGL